MYEFLILILLQQFSLVIPYKCGHKSSRNRLDNTTIISSKYEQKVYALSSSKPLPLIVHYEFDKTFYNLKNHDIIKYQVLEKVKQDLKLLVKVRSPMRPLRLRRSCKGDQAFLSEDRRICVGGCRKTKCGDLTISDKFLSKCTTKGLGESTNGPGVDADLILYITSTVCEDVSVLASSLLCQQDEITDRPIAAIVNICKSEWIDHNIQSMINMVKHEIIHVLGFDENLFAFFRDANGKPLTSRNKKNLPSLGIKFNRYNFDANTAKKAVYQRQDANINRVIYNWVITLPLTMKEYAAQFNISIRPVPLEDFEAEDSGINSHFDELALGTELMTPINADGMEKLSRITLAFLEDTGWYKANYSMAEVLDYGKDMKMDFFSLGCYMSMMKLSQTASLMPFCNTVLGHTLQCSKDRKYVEICSIFKYPKLKPKYQHFITLNGLPPNEKVKDYGGPSEFSERCPHYRVWKFTDESKVICTNKKMAFRRSLNDQFLRNYFNTDSICVETGEKRYIIKDSKVWEGDYGAACFKYSCDTLRKVVHIYSQKRIIANCKTENKIIKFDDEYVIGSIKCPSFKESCIDREYVAPESSSNDLSNSLILIISAISFNLLKLEFYLTFL